MSAIFVTATGTDIGKTFVACGIVAELKRRGRRVAALKPVASGFEESRADESDPGLLLAALGLETTAANLDHIAPWRYKAAFAPDMAARAEGKSVDFAAVVQFCRDAVRDRSDLIIEGVGGVMSPVSEAHTVLDWMTALGLPVLVVSGTYLGAQSHALTALAALKGRNLAPIALALSETPESTVSLAETAASLARFAPGLPIVTLPRQNAARGFARLADLL
jgi:dethiobiotin synthetase